MGNKWFDETRSGGERKDRKEEGGEGDRKQDGKAYFNIPNNTIGTLNNVYLFP